MNGNLNKYYGYNFTVDNTSSSRRYSDICFYPYFSDTSLMFISKGTVRSSNEYEYIQVSLDTIDGKVTIKGRFNGAEKSFTCIQF